MEGNKLQEAAVEALVETDEYYQSIATPLKSAEICKAEHLAFLKEAVKMEKFRTEFNNAVDLLILEMLGYVGEKRWKEILAEFSEGINQGKGFIEHEANQVIYNFSEKTLDQIYQLGRTFLQRSRFSEAYSIFLFLAYLNPQIPDYWLGMGISRYSLREFKEALVYLKMAAILLRDKAAVWIYTILCHIYLKNYETAKSFLGNVEHILANSVEEKNKWMDEYARIKQQLIKGG